MTHQRPSLTFDHVDVLRSGRVIVPGFGQGVIFLSITSRIILLLLTARTISPGEDFSFPDAVYFEVGLANSAICRKSDYTAVTEISLTSMSVRVDARFASVGVLETVSPIKNGPLNHDKEQQSRVFYEL